MVIRRAWLDFRIIYLPKRGYRLQNSPYFCVFKYTWAVKQTSSETQGQIVGARESLNRWKNMTQKKSKERPEELFSPFFSFLRTLFFRPFRLSLAPTICPWVSEDEFNPHFAKNRDIPVVKNRVTRPVTPAVLTTDSFSTFYSTLITCQIPAYNLYYIFQCNTLILFRRVILFGYNI